MIEYAAHRRIDSVWTVQFHRNDNGTVEIISFSHKDPVGYEREHEIPEMKFVEDEKRIVLSLKLRKWIQFNWDNHEWDEELTISNPAHVFSYKLKRGD